MIKIDHIVAFIALNIDGEFVNVSGDGWSVGCNNLSDSISYGDDKIEAGKIYYYKAQVTVVINLAIF